MTDHARITSPGTQSARKTANDRLARRATTAVISVAICLVGLLTGAASTAQAGARTVIGIFTPTDDSSSTALAKALADYDAAVAAQHQAPSPAPARLHASAPPRRASAPAPVAVTGGS